MNDSDEIEQARVEYKASLGIYRTVYGKDHLRISVVLEKIGTCLIRLREHAEAMKVLNEAIDIRKERHRINDLGSADIYFALGIVSCESGTLNVALDHYEEALIIRRKILGDDSVAVAHVRMIIYSHTPVE